MPSIAEIREQYPQYDDMSDDDLAGALHKKSYADMPYNSFRQKIGMVPQFEPGVEGYNAETGMVDDPRSKSASAAYGAADQMSFGFGDELSSYLGSWISGKPRAEVLKEIRSNQKKAQRDNPGSYLGGQLAGGVAQAAVAGPATMTARMGGSTLGRAALGSAIDGAALGGAYGVGSGENAKERATGGLIGAGSGAIIGAATPYIAKGVTEAGRRLVSPFTISPERQAAASTLAKEGVDLTAGQKTGSQALRYAESEIGGRKAADIMERQGEQFTTAALKRAGINANRAMPDVIDDAFRQTGKLFDDLGGRNNLVPDQPFIQEMQDALSTYGSLVPESQRAPAVANMVKDLGDSVKRNGYLPGDSYKALRSRLGRLARSTRDPEVGSVLRGMEDALDGAMERSILQTNPADAGAWRAARNQYRNLLVLEKASTRAGEDAAQGLISPSALRGATVTKQGVRNYARGKGDFAELARAGEALLKPLPNSGTAARNRAQNLGVSLAPTILGSAGGAGYGAHQGGTEGALIGAAAGAALPRIAGSLMMSKPVQNLLANQLLAGSAAPAQQKAVTGLLNMLAVPQATGILAPPFR